MAELEVTFFNEADIRVQAQVYAGRTLVSTCVVDPGETRLLQVTSTPYDIFCKNSVTGWELARQLESEATTMTLQRRAGRYVMKDS